MKTISQRELRNDSAGVLRAVEQGDTFTVTRRGVPVAQIGPISEPDLRCDRPARHRLTRGALPRVRISEPTEQVLEDLRSDR